MFFKTFVKVAHKGCLYELINLRIGDKIRAAANPHTEN